MLSNVCKLRFLPNLERARIILDAYVEEEKRQDINVIMGNRIVTVELTCHQLNLLTRLLSVEAYKWCPERFRTDDAKHYTFVDYLTFYCDKMDCFDPKR